MKKLIHLSVALLGVCAVVVAAPPSARATDPAKSPNPPSQSLRASVFDAKPSPGYRDRVVYVISNDVETGSNIPTVFRVYHGVVTSSVTSRPATYYNLTSTGSENIGEAISKLDPSVTVSGRH